MRVQNKLPLNPKGNDGDERELFPLEDNFVCCGRGKAHTEHPGNLMFREAARACLPKYNEASSKTAKSKIVAGVLESLRKKGVRFVKNDLKTGLWYDIGIVQSHEKTGHAIRDLMILKQKKYENMKRKGKIVAKQSGATPHSPNGCSPKKGAKEHFTLPSNDLAQDHSKLKTQLEAEQCLKPPPSSEGPSTKKLKFRAPEEAKEYSAGTSLSNGKSQEYLKRKAQKEAEEVCKPRASSKAPSTKKYKSKAPKEKKEPPGLSEDPSEKQFAFIAPKGAEEYFNPNSPPITLPQNTLTLKSQEEAEHLPAANGPSRKRFKTQQLAEQLLSSTSTKKFKAQQEAEPFRALLSSSFLASQTRSQKRAKQSCTPPMGLSHEHSKPQTSSYGLSQEESKNVINLMVQTAASRATETGRTIPMDDQVSTANQEQPGNVLPSSLNGLSQKEANAINLMLQLEASAGETDRTVPIDCRLSTANQEQPENSPPSSSNSLVQEESNVVDSVVQPEASRAAETDHTIPVDDQFANADHEEPGDLFPSSTNSPSQEESNVVNSTAKPEASRATETDQTMPTDDHFPMANEEQPGNFFAAVPHGASMFEEYVHSIMMGGHSRPALTSLRLELQIPLQVGMPVAQPNLALDPFNAAMGMGIGGPSFPFGQNPYLVYYNLPTPPTFLPPSLPL